MYCGLSARYTNTINNFNAVYSVSMSYIFHNQVRYYYLLHFRQQKLDFNHFGATLKTLNYFRVFGRWPNMDE